MVIRATGATSEGFCISPCGRFGPLTAPGDEGGATGPHAQPAADQSDRAHPRSSGAEA